MSRLSRGQHFLGGFGTDNFLEDYFMDRNFQRNPVTNISENDERYKVELGIPGYKSDELEISVQEPHLLISGMRKKSTREKEVEAKKDEYRHQEFDLSTFEKSFHLPDNIDTKNISAMCKNGVLEIILPKKEAKRHTPSVIQIR